MALNGTIMIVAFAPIVGLLWGLSGVQCPGHLFLSVVCIAVLAGGEIQRKMLGERRRGRVGGGVASLGPVSLAGLA